MLREGLAITSVHVTTEITRKSSSSCNYVSYARELSHFPPFTAETSGSTICSTMNTELQRNTPGTCGAHAGRQIVPAFSSGLCLKHCLKLPRPRSSSRRRLSGAVENLPLIRLVCRLESLIGPGPKQNGARLHFNGKQRLASEMVSSREQFRAVTRDPRWCCWVCKLSPWLWGHLRLSFPLLDCIAQVPCPFTL